MLDLTRHEHQELVLHAGSRKGWITYLGLDPATGTKLWNELDLKSPAAYVKALRWSALLEILAEEGSIKKAASRLGVSEAFLKPLLHVRGSTPRPADTIVVAVWKYKSIALATRFLNLEQKHPRLSEAEVRKVLKANGHEPAMVVDYAFSNHEAGKGRRAELEWKLIRGDKILRDMNESEGSQAAYDFEDRTLGRVNVKSSRQHQMRAKSRGRAKFWKFSSHGKEQADTLVCMCYGINGELVCWFTKKPHEIGNNSFQITEHELEEACRNNST